MNQQLEQRIRQCPTLPSLPAIALQVLELTQKEQVDIAEIARIISKDPALSSKILRTVNSSFYGRSQSISTISHALVILGLQSVKTLVLGFSLVTRMAKTGSRGFKHIDYWRRSVYAATAARTLAGKLQIVQQEECFLAALLMDIGMLVLDQVIGDPYGQIHSRVSRHGELAMAEQAALGMSHGDVSGILAGHWKLPPVLAVPMSHHHRPQDVTDPALQKLSEVVCMASQCADIFVEENAAEPIALVRTCCQEKFSMTESACDAMLDEIGHRTREVAPMFEVSIAASANYESILKSANEALVDLTLRTQQQAASLEQQNMRLKEQATTDALTGLANRAQLDQFIAGKFAAAASRGKPLAMLMIDVDRFKLVNDQHGHAVGDQVLRWVGRILRAAARATDLAARYGGEELALIMPDTSKASAAATAECIRRAISARPVACDGATVPVTVSIGVAALEAGVPFTQPVHLMKAADLAVYAAKNGGRNCVKVFSIKAGAAATAAA